MTEKKETAETVKEESGTKMYVGPTFPGVSRASVYVNGLPGPLKEKMEKYPVFGELVVNIGDLVAKRKEMEDPASALSKYYKAAADILKKGE